MSFKDEQLNKYVDSIFHLSEKNKVASQIDALRKSGKTDQEIRAMSPYYAQELDRQASNINVHDNINQVRQAQDHLDMAQKLSNVYQDGTHDAAVDTARGNLTGAQNDLETAKAQAKANTAKRQKDLADLEAYKNATKAHNYDKLNADYEKNKAELQNAMAELEQAKKELEELKAQAAKGDEQAAQEAEKVEDQVEQKEQEVEQDKQELEATPAENAEAAPEGTETPTENSEGTANPENPANPESAANPETPTNPETPNGAVSENPAENPENVTTPENPANPEGAANPANPENPTNGGQTTPEQQAQITANAEAEATNNAMEIKPTDTPEIQQAKQSFQQEWADLKNQIGSIQEKTKKVMASPAATSYVKQRPDLATKFQKFGGALASLGAIVGIAGLITSFINPALGAVLRGAGMAMTGVGGATSSTANSVKQFKNGNVLGGLGSLAAAGLSAGMGVMGARGLASGLGAMNAANVANNGGSAVADTSVAQTGEQPAPTNQTTAPTEQSVAPADNSTVSVDPSSNSTATPPVDNTAPSVEPTNANTSQSFTPGSNPAQFTDRAPTIANTNDAVANAHPGDVLQRNDGTRIEINQGDIDWAKAHQPVAQQPVAQQPVAQPVEPIAQNTTQAPSFQPEFTGTPSQLFNQPKQPDLTGLNMPKVNFSNLNMGGMPQNSTMPQAGTNPLGNMNFGANPAAAKLNDYNAYKHPEWYSNLQGLNVNRTR